ncbi:unnamed protein product [Prunus brigantina]
MLQGMQLYRVMGKMWSQRFGEFWTRSKSFPRVFEVGATGKALKDVIVVGIGGSFLGPLQTVPVPVPVLHENRAEPDRAQPSPKAIETASRAFGLQNQWTCPNCVMTSKTLSKMDYFFEGKIR